jgi:hypothetical protein
MGRHPLELYGNDEMVILESDEDLTGNGSTDLVSSVAG